MANFKFKDSIDVGGHTHANPAAAERSKHQVYNKTVGKWQAQVTGALDKVQSKEWYNVLTSGTANKTWRAMILLNRMGLNPFDFVSAGIHKGKEVVNDLTKKGIKAISTSAFPGPAKRKIIFPRGSSVAPEAGQDLGGRHISAPMIPQEILEHPGFKGMFNSFFNSFDVQNDANNNYNSILEIPESNYNKHNRVMIFNPLIEDNGHPMGIILQNRPREIEYNPQSAWADIKSFGRNVPMYHYTGSETTLQFTTSWYMPYQPGHPDFDLYWVVNQCRILESWSMANGFMASPPYLFILWGDSNLFSKHLWILQSATYRLSDFHDTVMLKTTSGKKAMADDWIQGTKQAYSNKPEEFALINQGLVPFSATQELIFKRISGINLWYSDILPPDHHSLKTNYMNILGGNIKKK